MTPTASPAGNGRYLRTARGESTDCPPVWLMRQAGRYLPEYLAVRAKHGFLEVCGTPELAVEVTMQPIRRFGFDAAILFSDILVPLVPMGADLSFGKGHGPRIANPLRDRAAIGRVRAIDPRAELGEVLEALRRLRRELPAGTALIGFCGAPFTLACYWVEGAKPEPFAHVKSLMYHDPAAFAALQEKLADMVVDYLLAMIEAGADALQLFDTWAGVLSPLDFREFLLPVLQDIFARLQAAGVPTTYFARGSSHLIGDLGAVGSTIVGLDWCTPLDRAREVLGPEPVLQGNLDPTILLGSEETIRRRVRQTLAEGGGRRHIFNLGHGILPMTPIPAVEILLDEVRGECL